MSEEVLDGVFVDAADEGEDELNARVCEILHLELWSTRCVPR